MPSTASAIGLPFTEAIDFFRQKENLSSTHWTDVMNEAHSHGFAVAGAASKALVQDFRAAVDKAISQGTGLHEFRKDFDTIVKTHGWTHTGNAGWRARVIYETNLATAFSAGRYAQLTDPDTLAAFPYWQYNHTACANPRLQHLAWDGLVLPADDAFWASCYPPNGWGCRCYVTPVSMGMLRRMGKSGPDTAPPFQMRDFTNKRTGEVTQVPAGIDPGFNYNPGQAWLQGAKPVVSAPRMVADSPNVVLALPGRSAVPPAVLQKFIAAPQGAIQVGTLNAKTTHLLRAKSPQVLLSAETLAKQAVQHPDLPKSYYGALDELLRNPEAVMDNQPGRLRILGRIAGAAVSVVIKRTASGNETYLVNLHAVREKSVRKFLAQHKVLTGDVNALLEFLGKRTR
jgi:hypothetical protein